MKLIRNSIVAAALGVAALALLPASGAYADAEVNVTLGGTEAGPGLAARGYDVVSYFTEGKPALGSEAFAAAHDGATYRFASEANLDRFKANPRKYLPQYGGYCAYGCFVGKKFDGDPTLWKIVDDKLYFNLNPTIQAKWSEQTSHKIRVADDNWTKIEHLAPGEIK